MKKILFLFPHFLLPGGAASSTVQFARTLNERGYDTEILCAGANNDFLNENSDLKFTILDIPHSGSFFYWILFPFWQMRINTEISKYPDYILFPQVLPSNWWAWIFKRTHRNWKVVWYCHEPSAFIHSPAWIRSIQNPLMRIGAIILNPLLKFIDISLEHQNDIVFCNSNHSASEYEKCYHRKPDAVIYPPSDIKSTMLSKNKRDYIFSVSHLSKFKNVDLLIEAFLSISKTHPSYSLIIAGDGEEKVRLEQLAHDKGLESFVTFCGKVSNDRLADLYADARVTVLCSINEPFGLVPIESMSFGTPVIAHKSGGPMETIIDGITGFLFENPGDLVSLLERTINLNSDQYEEMQKNSQSQAAEFNRSKSTAQLERIFQKL